VSWLRPQELRVGLGTMRLSTERTRDEAHARAVVHAALDGGIRLFDTAYAYGLGERDYNHNERWLGRFLAEHPRGNEARVITKGGMLREGLKWIPDGKASTLEAHCAASREALGRDIDLYLLHVPDKRVGLATSVRALQSLKDRGLVKAIGVSNVTRTQLDEALGLAEISAVELAVSLLDDSAIRGGVVAGALTRGVSVLCHSPLGGPKKFHELGTMPWLQEKAREANCTPWEWALAQLLSLSDNLAVLPGARRVETVQSCIRASTLSLSRASERAEVKAEGKVLLLMGLQGSGKTSAVARAVGEGLTRLNRDTEGGTLEELHRKIGPLLLQGKSVVLDNTYVTRAQRGGAIAVAAKHGAPVHGVWHDIDPEQAQINIVLRMLQKYDRLLSPEELQRGKTPEQLGPRGFQMTQRNVEPLGDDEGFASLERVPFVRRPWPWKAERPALFIGLEQKLEALPNEVPADWPRIVIGWKELGATLPAGFINGVCPHASGPPTCWCRPPFPGFALFHARALGISFEQSRFLTDTPSLKKLATALGIPLVG
jgi:aryl-alcohol dehydrogenase-like predicted oxidoreductase/predicted kinase